MKNNSVKFKIFLISFLLAATFILPIFVFAEYTFLEPLPGLDKTIETGKLSVYLSALFNFAIAVAAVLAVIMIVIGGLQYIGAAGNTSVIEDAKDRIYWAVVGLFLALGSWMILFNINPKLKELELKGVDTQTTKAPTSTPPTITTAAKNCSKKSDCDEENGYYCATSGNRDKDGFLIGTCTKQSSAVGTTDCYGKSSYAKEKVICNDYTQKCFQDTSGRPYCASK